MHGIVEDTLVDNTAPVGVMPIIVMMSSLAAQSILFSLPPPLLPSMARTFGAHGPFIAQMVIAIGSLGLMITSVVSGPVVRMLGVRRTIIISLAIAGLASIIPAFSVNAAILLGSRLVFGGALGLLTTGCTMLLAHCYSGTARSKAIGYQAAIGSTAGLVALLIAGATVSRLGWHLPFLVYGLFLAPVLAMAVLGVPTVPIPPAVTGEGLGGALARIWPVCLAGCLLMMVPMVVGSQGPFVLTEIGVTSPLQQSISISMVTLLSAVTGAMFGNVQAAIGVRQTFCASLVALGLGLACIGFAAAGWMVTLGCALIGAAVGLYIPHLYVLSTNLVPESMRGHSIGLLSTSMFLGGFLFAFLFGGLEAVFGLEGAFQAIALAPLVAAIIVLLARRSRLAGHPHAVSA